MSEIDGPDVTIRINYDFKPVTRQLQNVRASLLFATHPDLREPGEPPERPGEEPTP